MEKVDAVVVGAGVIGLAIARELSLSLNNVLVIDQHRSFGEETSSRNSEVIHAGLYYPTDSLKAKFCVSGKNALYEYCQSRGIAHREIGKLLVAQDDAERTALEEIMQQASRNDVNDLRWLSKRETQNAEPMLRADAVLSSPSTGIIDVHQYMQALIADIEASGGMFVAQSRFISAQENNGQHILTIDSQGQKVQLACQYFVNSGGLHSTAIARAIEGLNDIYIPKIYFCRGHYFSFQGKSPFKQLIYPVPSENGLGIHASLDSGGQLKFGPDTEYISSLTYTVNETLKQKFFSAISRYFPAVNKEQLQPAYAGIRPKLQGPKGAFEDFVIQGYATHKVRGLVNLFGIDSPGLTSSLAIAAYVKSLLLSN